MNTDGEPIVRTPLHRTAEWPEHFVARYQAAGYWQDETHYGLLRRQVLGRPEAIAVVDGERRWTYRELDRRAVLFADRLSALGVRPGDRVVLHLPNIAEYLSCLFGVFALGALPVFALAAHREYEISHLCELSDAAAHVITPRFNGVDYLAIAEAAAAGLARPPLIVTVAPEPVEAVLAGESPLDRPEPTGWQQDSAAIASLQLSGGTTGTPKLIPRTHRDYLYSVRASAEICGLTEDSRFLVALPASHNFTMSSPGILGVLHVGGTVVLAADPSPTTALPLIAEHGVTVTALVPPLALAWAAAAARLSLDLSSLQLLQVGGARLSREAASRVRGQFDCTLQQVFGMAEGLVNYTRLDDDPETVLSTQGRPISPDDEVRVVDDDDRDLPDGQTGHLLTRGPYTIRGYYRAESHNELSFTADGFYRTGDLVKRLTTADGEGYLVVEGRAKDQINRGGEKIDAEEVENILLGHPGVHDAAVVGVADPVLGERSCAVVVVADGQPRPSALDLKKHVVAAGLARYKVPDRVEFLPAFPSTGIGKVSKAQLRRQLVRQLC